MTDRTTTASVVVRFDVDSPLPWRASHAIAAAAGMTVGATGLVASWWATSRTARLSALIGWMNLGAASVMVIGATLAMVVMTGRRAIGLRQAQLSAVLEGFLVTRLPLVDIAGSADATDVAVDAGGRRARLVWAPGMTRYHREGCQLALGKQVRAASLNAHEKAGRRPCAMCVSNELAAS
ncbi:MAG: hypothetical protein ACYDH6_18635 [Acidimicrobiales bacterium]